jgi:hypothetical protein
MARNVFKSSHTLVFTTYFGVSTGNLSIIQEVLNFQISQQIISSVWANELLEYFRNTSIATGVKLV